MVDRQKFLPFKGRHRGQSAVLFATGPSLAEFRWSMLPNKPDISVGVNTAIFRDDLDFDYYWCAHFYEKETEKYSTGPRVYYDKIVSRSSSLQVFCGTEAVRLTDSGEVRKGHFWKHFYPEQAEAMNAIQYDIVLATTASLERKERDQFAADLLSRPLYQQSIVFPPMQFLLYAGVTKVYLVGCDCGGDVKGGVETPPLRFGTSYDQEPWEQDDVEHYEDMEDLWREFSKFRDKHYPAVEIISVNPLNLAGLFPEVVSV